MLLERSVVSAWRDVYARVWLSLCECHVVVRHQCCSSGIGMPPGMYGFAVRELPRDATHRKSLFRENEDST